MRGVEPGQAIGVTLTFEGERDGAGNRGTGAVRGRDAVGDDPQGCSGARQARAAGHAGRDDGGLGAARSGRRAGATDRDRWPRRDRLRAGLAGDGSAHGGVAQRAGGALDRAVRGASLRLLPGRRAGLADRAGQRRVAGAVRPGDAGRADPRLRRRRPVGCGDDGPADRPPEWPGASPGRGGGRRAAARIDGRADERRAPDRRDPRPHAQLHQRRGGRHRAERGGRDEWLRRRARAGAGAGRRGRAAERHRGGLRPPGRRRIPSRGGDGSWASAGRSAATTSGCAPAATRSTRRWTRWKTSSPSSGRLPTGSSASRWPPTGSPRTCASPTRSTTSRPSTRCPTRPPRWCCEATRAITPSPRRSFGIPRSRRSAAGSMFARIPSSAPRSRDSSRRASP